MKTTRPRTIREIMLDGTLIDEAMKKAAREALALYKRAGVPVPVWRDGKIVWIRPEDIGLPDEGDSLKRKDLNESRSKRLK